MNYFRRLSAATIVVFLIILTAAADTRADAVSDWNTRACDLVASANLHTPAANRLLAIMHTAIYEAVNAISKKYPASDLKIDAPANASVDAAIAAASRATLLKLLPEKQKEIEAVYQAVLESITGGTAKQDGIIVGENAAAAVLAMRMDDGANAIEAYRPYTIAGVYVPTVVPLVSNWPLRKPWLMTGTSQFRPGPPPDLKSDLWARDYNEIKALGAKNSSTRTPEQTEIARFWEATGPSIYQGIILSVANTPGREITRNARLLMAVTQATDDAMIAVFDAKYHYNFWRPITAIRNGDIDGNDATTRDPSWTPFINTPLHPEYPCAHCIVSGAVGSVLQAEIGSGSMPILAATSPTANNAKRTWKSPEDFMQEVANGRIFDGVHFRTSTEVATAMGRKIGQLAAAKYLRPGK